MAFSSAPEKDTYSTSRVSLINDLDARPGVYTLNNTAVSGMLNVLAFTSKGQKTGSDASSGIYGQSRDCLTAQVAVQYTTFTAQVRGFYVWEKVPGTSYFYLVCTDGTTSKVYTSTSGTYGTWTAVDTIANADTVVRFVEFINDSGVKSLIMVTGTEGYVYTSNAAGTKITSPQFPNPHLPFPVFLDGYLFLAKKDTGDIYNSDLNDPAAWTAGSFISSESFPDDLQALVRVNSYILAVGKTGSEFFFDAANATASPLARSEGASLPFGTNVPNSIASNTNTIVMLANSSDGDAGFKVIEGTQYHDVPGATVLTALRGSGILNPSSSTPAAVRSSLIRQNGELIYLLNFVGLGAGPLETVACSLGTGFWSRLQLGTQYFPAGFASSSVNSNLKTYMAGVYQVDARKAFVGYLDPTAFMDTISTPGFAGMSMYVTQEMVTPPQTFDTMNRKFLHRLGVYYIGEDEEAYSGKVLVSYSDDGGTTWSTPVYTAPSSAYPTANQFPFVVQLGSFRSRMFKIYYVYKPMRWMYLELDINKGQQ